MSFEIEANTNIIEMEYAVRGPIPQRAAELQAQGKKTIPCNIGNPQALGQQPITFYRQVLSLVESPSYIDKERLLNSLMAKNKFEFGSQYTPVPELVIDIAEKILEGLGIGKSGAYTESKGTRFIRDAIAAYIDQRDGADSSSESRIPPADPEMIFLTNGASEGARHCIEILIAKENDGIMIPIPQYPLYSATIGKCGGVQVDYYPDEENDWALSHDILLESYEEAQKNGVDVKAIVVINPGNPTGAILDEKSINTVISFAEEKGLVIIADEVYQENLYGANFFSFAHVLGNRKVPLLSLHSTSKGFYGECGHRGGYLEVRNPPTLKGCDLGFVDVLIKQASVSLCSNTVGQILTYLMVYPLEKDSETSLLFVQEKDAILKALFEKATVIREAFDQMKGVRCYGRTGAMYLFPNLGKLPVGKTDFDYCMALLEKTGLCTVNGSGFGQRKGTHHLRIAFLPPKNLLEEVLPQWIEFHNSFVEQ